MVTQASVGKLILFFLILSVAAVACGGAADDGVIEPPEIRYGEDICEVCGMIISEARFAAACVTTDGEGHPFDGIGEMLKREQEKLRGGGGAAGNPVGESTGSSLTR